jgi:hypothetical protein
VLAIPVPVPARAADASAAAATTPAWVATSNGYAQILLKAQGPFQPEQLSFLGVPGYDDQVFDFGPDNPARFRAAMTRAKAELLAKSAMKPTRTCARTSPSSPAPRTTRSRPARSTKRLVRPFADVGQTVFQGLQGLLNDQTQPERRALAIKRLQRYTGLAPGSTALATLARQRYDERSDPKLLQPYPRSRCSSRSTTCRPTSAASATCSPSTTSTPAPRSMRCRSSSTTTPAWTKTTVLPHARTTYSLPPELYALQLKNVGIDIDPRALIERAEFEFMEIRGAMQQLAPLVAKQKGIAATGYLDVIRALKHPQLARNDIEPYYRNTVIRRWSTPSPSIASSACRTGRCRCAWPAMPKAPRNRPRTSSPRRWSATPASRAPSCSRSAIRTPRAMAAYDDFNYPSAAWTLTAHEGRPGHELQFTAMIERGVSLARTLFAFNSVNVEGWALYAESEALPYEPLDGQLIALQLRLQRAARAVLDPMLNLGLTDRDTAFKVLTDQVGLSKGYARQEIDRYTVNSPGQAGSYFYGYSRIQQLRAETEIALGDRFDRKAFNDFLLDQGLLPPDLLAQAVREVFVPAQKSKH